MPLALQLSDGLGPLPEPALHMVADENGVSVYPAFYTADQMLAYAAQQVAEDRRRSEQFLGWRQLLRAWRESRRA